MAEKELASVGVFFIALFGYLIATGFCSVLSMVDSDHDMFMLSWLIGAVIYAVTVTVTLR